MKQSLQNGLVPLWLVIFLLASALTANGILYAAKTYPRPLPPLVISHSPQPSDIETATVSLTELPKPDPSTTNGFVIIPGTNASDWNTYRNTQHGFEFRYPRLLADLGVEGKDGRRILFHILSLSLSSTIPRSYLPKIGIAS